MKIPNKLYDVLKWIAIVVIPAVSTLLSVILSVWHILPAETISAIATTLAAIETFLGALLGISTYNYNKSDDGQNHESI